VLEVLLRDARGTVANAKACDRRGVCKRTLTRVGGLSYQIDSFGCTSQSRWTLWCANFIKFREVELAQLGSAPAYERSRWDPSLVRAIDARYRLVSRAPGGLFIYRPR